MFRPEITSVELCTCSPMQSEANRRPSVPGSSERGGEKPRPPVLPNSGRGAGAWTYHCHVQSHSDMGMGELFRVKKQDGTIPGYEPHDHGVGGAPALTELRRPSAGRERSHLLDHAELS